jgi:hypothetical protein
MLYQPTNIYPSMTGSLGNGVVDATEPLTVSFQVNGNSALQAFQITIYRNDSASTQLYTTGKLTQGCPFYGVDYAGNIQFFSYTIPAATLSANGIKNGGEYKLIIKQWWNSSDSVTQTSASAFITRSGPTLTLGTVPNPLEVREYTFSASYAQAQGDNLNWVRWEIALVDDGEYRVLKDTGRIYGTAQLQFGYDGMFSGSTYAIRCIVQTENGVEADTGWQSFAVQYEMESVSGTLTACQSRRANGARLTFPQVKNIPATITGNYTMSDSYLNLASGAKAVWNEVNDEAMQFLPPFDIVWRGKNTAVGTTLKVFGKVLSRSASTMLPSESCWDSVCYGNGTWVAVSSSGKIAYSTDNGTTWNTATSPSSDGWFSVCYGGGRFVAVACASSAAAYSTDGKNWTLAALPAFGYWNSVAYGNGRFVAIATGTESAWSEDGETWTAVEMPAELGWYSICFGAGRFIAVANSSASFASSTDGTDWGLGDLPEMGCWNCVTFGTGKFIAVQTGATCAYSSDGLNWISRAMPADQDWISVAYGNGKFMAVASESAVSAESTDGASWTAESLTVADFWECVCYGEDRFFVVADSGDRAVYVTGETTELDDVLQVDISSAKVMTITAHGSIQATQDLTPGTDLTLFFGKNTMYWSAGSSGSTPLSMEWTQINGFELNGVQSCDYLFLSNGNLTDAVRNRLLADMTYHPTDQSALFFADFNGSTNAGGIGDTKFSAFAIYRYSPGDATLTHVVNTTADSGNVIIDSGAVVGKEYVYYAFGMGASTYVSAALISNSITLCFWDWALMSCTVDSDGVYHPQEIFLFGKNLVSGSVSNNNTPQVLQNFTRYPTVQPAPWNYRSGALQSLIGTISDGVYSDTRATRDAIRALGTTQNTLFLKNRKGDLMKIRTNGAVEMETMDNAACQAQTMTLPWVEIGSADDAQIVVMNSDGAWPY